MFLAFPLMSQICENHETYNSPLTVYSLILWDFHSLCSTQCAFWRRNNVSGLSTPCTKMFFWVAQKSCALRKRQTWFGLLENRLVGWVSFAIYGLRYFYVFLRFIIPSLKCHRSARNPVDVSANFTARSSCWWPGFILLLEDTLTDARQQFLPWVMYGDSWL